MTNSGKPKRVSLSAKHLSGTDGQTLCAFLVKLTDDGVITEDEVFALSSLLQSLPSQKEVPGIVFLSEVLGGILADGLIDEAERRELHHAILRVLPPALRVQANERKRLVEDAVSQQCRREMNRATERQIAYIEDLGGSVDEGMTKLEASTLIDVLLENRPTTRQRMVLRFWDRLDIADQGIEAVSDWMDQWYALNTNHLKAWELWKEENCDSGGRDSYLVELVPLGIGYDYLKRVDRSSGRPSGCLGLILVVVILVTVLHAM